MKPDAFPPSVFPASSGDLLLKCGSFCIHCQVGIFLVQFSIAPALSLILVLLGVSVSCCVDIFVLVLLLVCSCSLTTLELRRQCILVSLSLCLRPLLLLLHSIVLVLGTI